MNKLFSSETWSETLYSLRTNKRRTIVTSIGIFFGMFFFVLLDGLGTGLGNTITEAFDTLSSNLVFLAGNRTTKPYQGYKANRMIELTYRDFLYLQQSSKTLDRIGCYLNINKENMWSQSTVSGNSKSAQISVYGISPDFPYELNPRVAVHGRLMSKRELSGTTPVCTIGSEIVEDLFDSVEEAVGEYLSINGIAFRIVGVMERKSDSFSIGYSPEWAIEVPIDFAVQGDLNHTLYMIGKLRTDSSVDDLQAELMPFVSRSHHIDPTDTGAVNIVDVESQVRIFRMINDLIGALVWIIGLGTLIIGVISVSNILLVTVKERQREIGVRRAIGAKPADIVLQFMLESVTMIFIAGLLGMLIALLLLLGVGAIAEGSDQLGAILTRPYPTPSRMLLSFIIMILGGIAAGLLPVQKALDIKAIDAIRDE